MTSFTIQNLKNAFTPRNIKISLPKNQNYIDDTMKKFFESNPELVGQTLTEITKPINSGMINRFRAIEKVINQEPNALEELSGLVGQNLRGREASLLKRISGPNPLQKIIHIKSVRKRVSHPRLSFQL